MRLILLEQGGDLKLAEWSFRRWELASDGHRQTAGLACENWSRIQLPMKG
ncbi:uncharacterized protein DS421_1g18580 [Arachis hypogaea]|nr:uncharacterized protein DS421_1g18580 [Arachis hypogaea]